MMPLTLKDLNAMNKLAQNTWGWGIRYYAERGEKNKGKFTVLALDPREVLWHTVDGATIDEAISKFLAAIKV